MTAHTERRKTCADLIADEMASREKQVGELFAVLDDDEPGATYEVDGEQLDSDTADDRLREIPLGLSAEPVIRVDLSCGGPQDYILWFPYSGRMTYHFLDWFDGAQLPIPEDSPLRRFVEHLVPEPGTFPLVQV